MSTSSFAPSVCQIDDGVKPATAVKLAACRNFNLVKRAAPRFRSARVFLALRYTNGVFAWIWSPLYISTSLFQRDHFLSEITPEVVIMPYFELGLKSYLS